MNAMRPVIASNGVSYFQIRSLGSYSTLGMKRKEMPPDAVRVPSQRLRAPSFASVTLVANDKGDNEMLLGAVHRSPGILFTAEENLS